MERSPWHEGFDIRRMRVVAALVSVPELMGVSI
jgi:hypothetical protein